MASWQVVFIRIVSGYMITQMYFIVNCLCKSMGCFVKQELVVMQRRYFDGVVFWALFQFFLRRSIMPPKASNTEVAGSGMRLIEK